MQTTNSDTMSKTINKNVLQIAIHVIGWGIFFTLPFFMSRGEQAVTPSRYLGYCFMPLSCLIVFYTNFCRLIDCLLFRKKVVQFILVNLLFILLLGFLLYSWQEFHRTHLSDPIPENLKALRDAFPRPPAILFLSRDILLMGLTVGLSVAIKMTGGWYKMENEKQELQKAQAEAELQNLKSQLNPHFLFNTLNNIYSLIAINQDKAQYAVQDLSKMLRHVLYENNDNLVSIDREFEFMRSYIKLMSLRLSKNTRLDVSIPENGKGAMIAPLLFIPLIENAFKHGVSNTQDSFIHIQLELHEDHWLHCLVVNSNFPKKDNDRSGSGIGMKNLKRRLELLYPNNFTFTTRTEDDRFIAELNIHL